MLDIDAERSIIECDSCEVFFKTAGFKKHQTKDIATKGWGHVATEIFDRGWKMEPSANGAKWLIWCTKCR